jgi:hypothetical protein
VFFFLVVWTGCHFLDFLEVSLLIFEYDNVEKSDGGCGDAVGVAVSC